MRRHLHCAWTLGKGLRNKQKCAESSLPRGLEPPDTAEGEAPTAGRCTDPANPCGARRGETHQRPRWIGAWRPRQLPRRRHLSQHWAQGAAGQPRGQSSWQWSLCLLRRLLPTGPQRWPAWHLWVEQDGTQPAKTARHCSSRPWVCPTPAGGHLPPEQRQLGTGPGSHHARPCRRLPEACPGPLLQAGRQAGRLLLWCGSFSRMTNGATA